MDQLLAGQEDTNGCINYEGMKASILINRYRFQKYQQAIHTLTTAFFMFVFFKPLSSISWLAEQIQSKCDIY